MASDWTDAAQDKILEQPWLLIEKGIPRLPVLFL